MLGCDPDPDIHLAARQLTEHDAHLVVAFDGHEPHGLFCLHATAGGGDLVVDARCGSAASVARGPDIGGACGEQVSIAVIKRPQCQRFCGGRGPLGLRERELAVQVFELGGVGPPCRHGQAVERHPQHCFGTDGGHGEEVRDGGDGRGPVFGLHDGIEHFVAAFEGGLEGSGDVTAGGGTVWISHAPILLGIGRWGQPEYDFVNT